MENEPNHIELPLREHIERYHARGLRSVSLIPELKGLRFLTRLIGLAVCILILFSMFVPWTQTVFGSGRVVAYSPSERQQDIEAPVHGRIERWHVSEGSHVIEGDLIVDIADIDPHIMERLDREQQALRAQLDASQKSLETSRINLDRQKKLWETGLSARRAFELAELEYAKFLGEVSAASAKLARIETKIARQASQSVTAPRSGILQRIHAAQGGTLVKQGDRLATIVPESSDRVVELFVSGNDIPLLSVGRDVRIQFEGWPAVQFAGWPSVAVGSFAGEVRVVDPSDDGTGKFRIVVFPKDDGAWPEARFLRQGVRAVGWVLLDEVSIGWELWRRFNSFPLSVPEEYEGYKSKDVK